MATLTYDYGEATVVLGPLSARREPSAYDLCQRHANSLTVPQGWQVIRLAVNEGPVNPDDEDLELLANIVRQASNRGKPSTPVARRGFVHAPESPQATGRRPVGTGGDAWFDTGVKRGHLRVISGQGEDTSSDDGGNS